LAILEHIPRVAGLVRWDKHGPRFKLTATGTAIQDGRFDDPGRLFDRWQGPKWIETALGNFLTWQRFFSRVREANVNDLALFLAVIRESAKYTSLHYPHSKFSVILWDGRDDARLAVIERELKKAGISVHRLTSIVPDFVTNSMLYVLSGHDLHPNPGLHKHLADYLAQHIFETAMQ
jgi:hypothetical protein